MSVANGEPPQNGEFENMIMELTADPGTARKLAKWDYAVTKQWRAEVDAGRGAEGRASRELLAGNESLG